MKAIRSSFFLALGTLLCFCQVPLTSEVDLMRFVQQIQSAANNSDAHAYSSLFAEDGTWDGPLGQNAIGPDNIQGAMRLTFRTFGPLQTSVRVVKRLAPEVVMVDLYEAAASPTSSPRDIPTAEGSAPPLPYTSLRMTLIIQKSTSDWKIKEARLADLRSRDENSPAVVKPATMK